MRTLRPALAAVAILAAAQAMTSPAAHASVEAHCVARLVPLASMATAAAPELDCFGTFAESIGFATGGAVRLDPKADRQTQLAELEKALISVPMVGVPGVGVDLGIEVLDANVVAGIDYSDWHYEGSSLTWTAPGRCEGNIGYGSPTMPAGWNDVVSSARGYNGCAAFLHYEDEQYTGDVSSCTCYYIGDGMNDKTSSVQVYAG